MRKDEDKLIRLPQQASHMLPEQPQSRHLRAGIIGKDNPYQRKWVYCKIKEAAPVAPTIPRQPWQNTLRRCSSKVIDSKKKGFGQDKKGQFHLVMKPPYKEKNRKRKSALVLN